MSDWKPRLIATDMDGTLLRGNDTVSDATVAEAGGRAIAVANAHPAVRAATTGLTGGHDADGVARYLEAVLRDV